MKRTSVVVILATVVSILLLMTCGKQGVPNSQRISESIGKPKTIVPPRVHKKEEQSATPSVPETTRKDSVTEPCVVGVKIQAVDWVTNEPISGVQFRAIEDVRGKRAVEGTVQPDAQALTAVSDENGYFQVDVQGRFTLETLRPEDCVVVRLELLPGKKGTVLCYQKPVLIRGVVRFEIPGEGRFSDVVVTFGPSTPSTIDYTNPRDQKAVVASSAWVHNQNVGFRRVKVDDAGQWEMLVPAEAKEVTVVALCQGFYLARARVASERRENSGIKFDFRDTVELILKKGKTVHLSITDELGKEIGPAKYNHRNHMISGARVVTYMRWEGLSQEENYQSEEAISSIIRTGTTGIYPRYRKPDGTFISGGLKARWSHFTPETRRTEESPFTIEIPLETQKQLSFLVVTPDYAPQLFHEGDPVILKTPRADAPKRYVLTSSKYPQCSFAGAFVKIAWVDGDVQAALPDIVLDDDGALARNAVVQDQEYSFVAQGLDKGKNVFTGSVRFSNQEIVDVTRDVYYSGASNVIKPPANPKPPEATPPQRGRPVKR